MRPPRPAPSEALDEVDRQAIRSVIEAQLAAFQADDGETAFGFASPTIQEMFGNPTNFLAMVKAGYMPVYRPREVRFRAAGPLPGRAGAAGAAGRARTSRW